VISEFIVLREASAAVCPVFVIWAT